MPARLWLPPWRRSRSAHSASAPPRRRTTVPRRAPGGQRRGPVKRGTPAPAAPRTPPRPCRQAGAAGAVIARGGLPLERPPARSGAPARPGSLPRAGRDAPAGSAAGVGLDRGPPAVDDRDALGRQAAGLLPLVARHEAAGGGDHPPPGQLVAT